MSIPLPVIFSVFCIVVGVAVFLIKELRALQQKLDRANMTASLFEESSDEIFVVHLNTLRALADALNDSRYFEPKIGPDTLELLDPEHVSHLAPELQPKAGWYPEIGRRLVSDATALILRLNMR